MDEKLLEEKLKTHDELIYQNSKDIDELKKDRQEDRLKQVEMYVKLDNLIEKVSALTSTMQWFTYGLIGGFAAFFIWVIQNKLF